MARIRIGGSVALLGLLLCGLFGCQQPNMEKMMQPVLRPAALDDLDVFIGEWQGSGEFASPGMDQPMEASGTSEYVWLADEWVMMERGTYTSKGPDGEEHVHTGVGFWVWNPDAKKFDTSWLDNHGNVGSGAAWYDHEARVWQMRYKGQNRYNNYTTAGEGKIWLTDNDTMKWEFAEWGPWKLKKIMSGQGTSTRQ